jgi:chromosome segregation ATPase
MKSKFEIRISKFEFICALVLLLACALASPAQTLADAARKERARQKQSQLQKQNKGTYTNATATVTSAPAKPAGAGANAAPEVKAETETPPKPAGPVDNRGRNEKYWRDAFENARNELRRAEEEVQIQEARVKDLNTQLLRQSDVYNRENVIGAQITEAQKALNTAKTKVEQAKNKVSNLEEELRSSGGLPGWAR